MRITRWFLAATILAAPALTAGTLAVSSITDPLHGFSANGAYSGFGDGATLSWSQFGVTADGQAGTLVMRGMLSCAESGGCGGGQPAEFRVDFTGSDFPMVDIDFQGILSSLAPQPDVMAVSYGTIHTVIWTGTPTYNGHELVEKPQDQIMSLTIGFGLDQPSDGKVTLAYHEATGVIPTGPFYGYTQLLVESLVGELDFTDPLTNNFNPPTAIPEPGSAALLGLGMTALALAARRRA